MATPLWPKHRPFIRYRAVRRVRTSMVSGAPALVVEVGDTIEYNGSDARLPGGRIVACPGLAAAIATGWLVRAEPK